MTTQATFSSTDNAFRHWTATIAHIQLLLGFVLYFTSPTIQYFFKHTKDAMHFLDVTFFSMIHISLMFVSIVIITVGSGLTKRKETDADKFKTMLLWFSIALVVIFIAIPWPFSPLSSRPLFREI